MGTCIEMSANPMNLFKLVRNHFNVTINQSIYLSIYLSINSINHSINSINSIIQSVLLFNQFNHSINQSNQPIIGIFAPLRFRPHELHGRGEARRAAGASAARRHRRPVHSQASTKEAQRGKDFRSKKRER